MRALKALLVVILAAPVLLQLLGGPAGAATGSIDIVEIEGILDPPSARFITDRIEAAATDGAQAVILRLDTPASIQVADDSAVVESVASSSVPIVVWVAPRGAVAIGTGGTLAYVADALYRADETTVRSFAPGTGFGRERPSTSAASLEALLQALDGTTLDGTVIESWDEERGFPNVLLRFQEMPLWDRLLHAVTTPQVALFLILLGAFGFVFEIYNPGIGIAAALGAVLLGLGFYALDVLPTNWGALLLIVAALIALIYDVHVVGFGIWTIGGLIVLAVGSVMLFPGGEPAALDFGPFTIVAALATTLVFFVSVMTAALRVRLRRPIADSEGVIGSIAEAQTDIAPEGTVLTNGTLWRARTMETGIAAGARVEVKATEGLVLLVEPLHEE
jgi:membrane-bound serine protease (ClpP class)